MATERFGYATKYRPISVGFTVPRDGWIPEPHDPDTNTAQHPFGVTYYNRELQPAELEAFEMVRVDPPALHLTTPSKVD